MTLKVLCDAHFYLQEAANYALLSMQEGEGRAFYINQCNVYRERANTVLATLADENSNGDAA